MVALRQRPTTLTLDDPTSGLPADFANRVALQGQITWSGLQDGYSDAGGSDSATPYSELYWNLGPVITEHCGDCPDLAMGSPYDPPWAGAGSNQLDQTPGDGQTDCGASCKCSLSYSSPSGDALTELGQAITDKWANWYPTGYDSEGNVLTSPINPPAAGSELSTDQKAALDSFRNSSDMWDTVRRNLPPMPSLFGTEDLPSPLPAWDALTDAQQAVVRRVEEAQEQWLNAAAKLVPAPVLLPDPATEMRAWLARASTGEFTPWWNEMDVTPSQESEIEAWLDAVGRGEVVQWPTPAQPEEYDAMQKWLDWASANLGQQTEGTDINTDFRASEPVVEQPVIQLYNPNHDSHGRFAVGSGVPVHEGRARQAKAARQVRQQAAIGKAQGEHAAKLQAARDELAAARAHQQDVIQRQLPLDAQWRDILARNGNDPDSKEAKDFERAHRADDREMQRANMRVGMALGAVGRLDQDSGLPAGVKPAPGTDVLRPAVTQQAPIVGAMAQGDRDAADPAVVSAAGDHWTGDPNLQPPFSPDEFDAAQSGLRNVGSGINAAKEGDIAGEHYVVKNVQYDNTLRNQGGVDYADVDNVTRYETNAEVAGSEVGKALGFGDNVNDTYAFQGNDGQHYVISAYRENSQTLESAVTAGMTAKDFDIDNARQLVMQDYIVGDPDRHGGNYLVTNGNHIVSIDTGRGFRYYGDDLYFSEAADLLSTRGSTLPRSLVQSVVDKESDVIGIMQSNHLDAGIPGVRARFSKLNSLLQRPGRISLKDIGYNPP